ncbi:DUF6297 family protein [Kineosporia rhizophila]|uniref:DUF6297 family protein n=1 Tax=Kineosporia rhizophila TaxID=84633 RepID=UPI001E56909E|nr:DUF6297 family protein [Kineosporia rhizophila]
MSRPLPSGTQVRRATRDATRYHSDARLGDLLGDVYTGLLTIALAASMIFALSSRLAPEAGGFGRAAQEGPGLAVGWIAVLLAVAAVASFVGLVTRLGPLSLSAAESAWWLPLPVDRRSLLRPAAVRWPAIGLVVGAISGAAVAVALPAGTAALLGSTALGAVFTVTLVIVAGLLQPQPQAIRALRWSADGVALAVPVVGIVLAFAGTAPPHPGLITLPLALLLTGVAVALGRRWDNRLDSVHGADLRHRGSVTDEALVAVLSLDTRALGRALTIRSESPQRSRSSRMSWLTHVPRSWRPSAALITSDAFLFARAPRRIAQMVLSLTLPGIGLLVPDPGPATTIVLLLIGGYIASLATGEGVRRAQLSPGLDAALPIAQRMVRLSRLALPATVMTAWFVAITAVLGWRYGDPAGWVLLGLLTGPAWGAATLRAGYRPVPTFGGPLIYTPMGSLPPGLSASMLRGPDLALVGSVPVVVALVTGTTAPVLFALALMLSLGTALFAVYEPDPTPHPTGPTGASRATERPSVPTHATPATPADPREPK